MVLGFVKAVINTATAVSIDGISRALHIGDSVFLGDVIHTGYQCGVAILLDDGDEIALPYNSQIKIEPCLAR